MANEALAMSRVVGWQNTVHTMYDQAQNPAFKALTLEQLRAIMPNLSAAKAQQYLPFLNSAMAEAGIDTPQRQAAFLAQVAHESGEFRYMEELADGSAYDKSVNPSKAKELGNTQPGDGPRFKGRGPIQLTGRNNYLKAGQALGLDLVGNPKQVADPSVGFRTSAWYWRHGSAWGDLNVLADKGDFVSVTKGINGGTSHLAERQAYWARAKKALGIG